jgi:hypothetical protein
MGPRAVVREPGMVHELAHRGMTLTICLIPARPSPAEIEAAAPTLAAVRESGKPFAFVLNQVQARSALLNGAAGSLGERVVALKMVQGAWGVIPVHLNELSPDCWFHLFDWGACGPRLSVRKVIVQNTRSSSSTCAKKANATNRAPRPSANRSPETGHSFIGSAVCLSGVRGF